MENSNFRTTIRALQFVTAWGLATAELGQEPQSIEEFAETLKMSRRTAFRNQEAFRQAYPTEDTPGRLNEVTGAQERYDATYRELRNIGKAVKRAEPLTFFVGSAIADV
jgi:hypothetical protein